MLQNINRNFFVDHPSFRSGNSRRTLKKIPKIPKSRNWDFCSRDLHPGIPDFNLRDGISRQKATSSYENRNYEC